MRRILAAVLCALVAGCTTPFSVPKTDDGSVRVDDKPLPPAESFSGIKTLASTGSTRVVWVHGMCTHPDKWAEERFKVLAAAIGIDPATTPETTGKPGEARTIRYSTSLNGNPFEVDYLLWSPLNDALKRGLDYDRWEKEEKRPGVFPYERASLNRKLKAGLVNDCLIDAVAYAGPNGDKIRSFMRTEVCRALGGNPSGGACPMIGQAPPATTVFVAESLGSKMLFDAVRSIYHEHRSIAGRANLSAQLRSVQLVFLLANQLPLLDAADQAPFEAMADEPEFKMAARAQRQAAGRKTDSSLVDFLGIIEDVNAVPGAARSLRQLDPVHLVAFSDPNDLLSYRLDPTLLHLENVKVANVIVSNAPTIFGLVSMPDDAHCGYKWNPYVIGTVAEGYKGGGVTKAEIPLEKNCGLAGAPEVPDS